MAVWSSTWSRDATQARTLHVAYSSSFRLTFQWSPVYSAATRYY